ncbi:hypothetical protein WJX81_000033 [Elliptochloris bilobata]|uniref:SANT domain-containing protein n=1 Tax=Elliptochloris bilobata TaxID=381761 RepID=A0AAW1SG65_9CHLO
MERCGRVRYVPVPPPGGTLPRVPPAAPADAASWRLGRFCAPAQWLDTAGALRWLCDCARSVVRPPPVLGGERVRGARQRWRETLQHARSATHSVGEEYAGRRSQRARQKPDAFVPEDARRSISDSDDDRNWSEVREGAEFQAEVPALRPRPPAPDADEAAREGVLVSAPRLRPMGPPGEPAPIRTVPCLPGGNAAADARLPAQRLDAGAPRAWIAVPPPGATWQPWALPAGLAEALGLVGAGAGAGDGWPEADVAAFEAGLARYGKDFDDTVAELLPYRTCGELVNFYYGVWKEQAHPRARAWYHRLALEAAAAAAAAAAAQAAREAAAVAAAAAAAGAGRRRQVREAMQWLRHTARDIDNASYLRARRMERVARARQALATANNPVGCSGAFIRLTVADARATM